ncbi:uncharacterized protein LOC112604348 [Melanaphis sacchari]|uniref:uncharacterized protein LOC112604348 n=1 Tax=Melanaphis sacchari TaxID=742174 RepID=UPI000DC14AFF|nr:uncharacterized protein LOC112604348 [Melanaphis sacchari]
MNNTNKEPLRKAVHKNPPGKAVGVRKKKMLMNMYRMKIKNEPNLKFSKLTKALSQETGIGIQTVRKTVRKYWDGQAITVKKRKIRPTLFEKIDNFDKCLIRQKIHSFWFRHEIPTSKNILFTINNDPDLPSLQFTSLKKLLKDLNFDYTRWNRNRCALTEKKDIVLWRRKYLEDIRRYRKEGRTIYYLEETWVNIGKYSQDELLDDKEPPGNSKRLIALHIGSVNGFVEGGLLCVEPKNNMSSYHENMNGDIYYDWFRGILPLLEDNSVIIMDNASHYSVANRVPTMSWKKDSILKWLEDKGLVLDRPMVKFQLIEKAKELRNTVDIYRRSIQEAINYNKAILRLPPYHSELNPIQLAWSAVNDYMKTNNCTSYKLDDICQLINDGVKLVTPEMMANFVDQSVKEEDKLWDLDFIIDEMLEEAVTASSASNTGVTINLVSSSELSDNMSD